MWFQKEKHMEVMIIMGAKTSCCMFEYGSEHVLPPKDEDVKRS